MCHVAISDGAARISKQGCMYFEGKGLSHASAVAAAVDMEHTCSWRPQHCPGCFKLAYHTYIGAGYLESPEIDATCRKTTNSLYAVLFENADGCGNQTQTGFPGSPQRSWHGTPLSSCADQRAAAGPTACHGLMTAATCRQGLGLGLTYPLGTKQPTCCCNSNIYKLWF